MQQYLEKGDLLKLLDADITREASSMAVHHAFQAFCPELPTGFCSSLESIY